MAERVPPSEQEVLGYFPKCSNWGKWGPDDEIGAANFITPEKRKQAVALVKEGVTVSLSRPLSRENSPDSMGGAMIHHMLSSGEPWAGKKSEPGVQQAVSDWIGLGTHGYHITHIDSLAHFFWDGKMYNGFPAESVTTTQGCTKEGIDLLKDGVVSRGVLLDIPKLKGVKWLEPQTPVFPEDLDELEKTCGVRVESGDVLLIRTGWMRMRNEQGPANPTVVGWPGLNAACIPWLYERQVAMLGADVGNEMYPSGYPMFTWPVHQVGLVMMGMWLLDSADLEGLAQACERYKQWEFLLTIGPLRIPNGTGSPVNPIVIF